MVLKKYKDWFIPLLLVLVIKILSLDKNWVETVYTQKIYPFISGLQRALFGWLPVSIGDIFYAIVIIWIIYNVLKGVRLLFKKQATWKGTGLKLLKAVKFGLWVYIVFNVFWGLNYNRKGIAWQLRFDKVEKNAGELITIDTLLLQKVNETKLAALQQYQNYPTRKELFEKAIENYRHAETKFPFLHYPYKSLKNSMFGGIGNYLGYTGYYNPFSGEAQVNTTVPKFFQPFTISHEIGHQLGFAKENEANFAAYLTATQSGDPLFQYSSYLEMFIYTNRTLYLYDSGAARKTASLLIPEVKADLEEARAFNRKHKSFIEPVIKWGYSIFLRSNEQPQGILSYDEVTALLIGYYKKYQRL